MKKKYIIPELLVFTAIFLFTGCESRLDVAEHGVSDIDSYYQTDDEVDQANTAIYSKWSSVYQSMCFIKSMLSDEYWSGGGSHYDGSLYKLCDYTFDSDISYIKTLYTNLYNTIYAANVVLEKVEGDSDIMKRAIAEAEVFRAMSNFELVTLWGTAPIVDHTLQSNEYSQGNGDKAAMWSLIESDLTDAINSGALTEKSSVDDKTYRITKQYAQALLGKTYVFEEKWSDAASILEQVINSGKYALFSDYSNISTIEGELNCESMFEINKPNDTSNPSLNFDMTWVYFGLRGEKFNVASSDLCGRTFGFCNPKKDLYDAFVAEEGKNGYRLKNSIITYEQLENEQKAYIADGLSVADNEGYFNFKNRILESDFSLPYNPPKNFRFMRYAEVLLLAAEANFEAGNTSKATEYVNQIRRRAELSDLSSVTMDVIKNEKRLELCFEMVRYQDLIRWGDAATVLADKGSEFPTLSSDGTVTWTVINQSATHGFKSGKHELLPFPATEIQVNENMTQNPGW